MPFEPRTDKWRSSDGVESYGLNLKDALFNKGRVQREARAARKRAERRARWKQSALRKWMWRAIWFAVLLMVWGYAVNQLGQGS